MNEFHKKNRLTLFSGKVMSSWNFDWDNAPNCEVCNQRPGRHSAEANAFWGYAACPIVPRVKKYKSWSLTI